MCVYKYTDTHPPLPSLWGKVKTAKSHLKQLQQCVQTLSTQSEESHTPLVTSDLSGVGRQSGDDFLWLTRHHAYITVYLVSSGALVYL